jgi:hypothetical protein
MPRDGSRPISITGYASPVASTAASFYLVVLTGHRPFGQRAERWVKTVVAAERNGDEPVTARILREDPEWGICFVKLLVFSDLAM